MTEKTISASKIKDILEKSFRLSKTIYDYYEENGISGVEYFAGEMNAVITMAFEIKEETGITVFNDEGVQS